MLLPDFHIENRSLGVELGLIEPFEPMQLQPASYDLTLDRQFLFPGTNNERFSAMTHRLAPGAMILACTRERINLPRDIAGEVSGRSRNARHGIQIEAAGHIDPGYCGVITLEIVNFGDSPYVLNVGMGIAKITFYMLISACRTPYSSERNTHQFSHGPRSS